MPLFDAKPLDAQPSLPPTDAQLQYIQNWLIQNAGKSVLPTGQVYTPSNVTESRSFDASTATATDVANALGTLIADLQNAGVIS